MQKTMKACTVIFLSFSNWIVISATLHQLGVVIFKHRIHAVML
jgi:hypothetical protein